MGLINLPFPNLAANTLARAAQVLANWTTIYNEFNGNISNANISASAAITQSKILNLPADLASKIADAGDTMTGPFLLRFDTPSLRLIGTEVGGKDWRVLESGGIIYFQRNDATEASPLWVSVFQMKSDGTATANEDVANKLYVDTYTRSRAFVTGIRNSTDVTTTSGPNDYENVSGLSAIITLGFASRVRVSTVLSGISNDSAGSTEFRITANGSNILQSHVAVGPGLGANASTSFVTDPMTAGQYTFQVQWRVTGGETTMQANTTNPAMIQLEQCPF